MIEQRAFAGRQPGVPQAGDAVCIACHRGTYRHAAQCGEIKVALHQRRVTLKELQFNHGARDVLTFPEAPKQVMVNGMLKRP